MLSIGAAPTGPTVLNAVDLRPWGDRGGSGTLAAMDAVSSADGDGRVAEPARTRLLAESERLQRLGAGLRREHADMAATRDPSGMHPADAASDLFEQERETSLREDVALELDEVRLAFGRLESGRYGRCEHCGEDIPDERLEAMPATRFCVLHEERFELRAGRAVGAAGTVHPGRSRRSRRADDPFLPTEGIDDTSTAREPAEDEWSGSAPADDEQSSEEAAMRLVDEP